MCAAWGGRVLEHAVDVLAKFGDIPTERSGTAQVELLRADACAYRALCGADGPRARRCGAEDYLDDGFFADEPAFESAPAAAPAPAGMGVL